jgi:predicted RNase H-like HicB family nuclease
MATYLEYLNAAIKKAEYENMGDGRIFASIPQFEGLWAVGQTRDEAARELYEALDAWLDVHIKVGNERPPAINGIDLFAPPKSVEN